MDYNNLIQPDDVSEKPFVFISYSRQDMQEVQGILKILRDNHFRFWYDMGLKSGTEWAEELGDKIDQCDQFLVVISPNSVNSKFVRKEIGMATERDKRILVLYLQETSLSSGLQLLLGDIQAIHKEFFSSEDKLVQSICDAISINTLYQEIDIFKEDSGFSKGAKKELLQYYNLLFPIGKGGLGQVYLAEQKRTGTMVAVKCGTVDDSYIGRVVYDCFQTEKEILSRLVQHMCPYVPVLLDWFEDTKELYLVETRISGNSLKENIKRSEDEVVDIAKKVLRILQSLHRNNIIYRDIKPENLIQSEHGEIFLIDFNTARVLKEAETEQEILLGTIGFSPPEQYNGQSPTDYSSDIYALGRTLEYLLCPEHFDKNKRFPIRYYREDVSPELEVILEKMTEPEPGRRYQTTENLLDVFDHYRENRFLNKILLKYQSGNRIKRLKRLEITDRKRRENEIAEFLNVSQIHVGEQFYDTAVLFEGKDNDTVAFEEE